VPSAVALVPARAGSKRVPGKNVRPLAGHPLLAYAIAGAREAGVFDDVIVSTDSEEIAAVAHHYDAEVPWLRPAEMATATSPDIDWVRWTLTRLAEEGRSFDLFSILRPTSPFRLGTAIRQAWDQLLSQGEEADSIRAVELCKQHPGKMWIVEGTAMRPLIEQGEGTPMHSRQYADLPPVYVQNSSLEIAWTRVALEGGTIAGERVLAFVSDSVTGFTIDYPEDWDAAERMMASGEATLPEIQQEPLVTGAAT
jgi:CMP-N,N'-diacetyllegionaminic acid synthase